MKDKNMNIWSKILLSICTLALVFALFFYAIHVRHHTTHHVIEYTITTDSLGVITPEARALADSLTLELQKQEHILQDKYEHAIEQQSNAQDMLAIGGLLLGIIVSLVGFFGYNSMESIKNKVETEAEAHAKKAYDDEIKNLQEKWTKEYLNDKVDQEINKSIKDALSEFEREKTASIDDLIGRMVRAELAIEGLGKKSRKEESNAGSAEPEPSPFNS